MNRREFIKAGTVTAFSLVSGVAVAGAPVVPSPIKRVRPLYLSTNCRCLTADETEMSIAWLETHNSKTALKYTQGYSIGRKRYEPI